MNCIKVKGYFKDDGQYVVSSMGGTTIDTDAWNLVTNILRMRKIDSLIWDINNWDENTWG